jgi:predicted Fe-S protein YdhL (DUF1289 family)
MKLRSQFGTFWAVLLATGLLCSPAFAQNFANIGQTKAPAHRPRLARVNDEDGTASGNNLAPRAMERLREIPPDKQEKFLQNNERFRNLPPDQQARIRERLEAWNKLTPAQQQEFRERQRIWEQMTPDQRREVQQKLLPRWQQVPPQRRRAIMQRLHQLRDLSESGRQAKLNDPSFVEGLNAEDRDMLAQLAHLHVGMAPD